MYIFFEYIFLGTLCHSSRFLGNFSEDYWPLAQYRPIIHHYRSITVAKTGLIPDCFRCEFQWKFVTVFVSVKRTALVYASTIRITWKMHTTQIEPLSFFWRIETKFTWFFFSFRSIRSSMTSSVKVKKKRQCKFFSFAKKREAQSNEQMAQFV